jgi:hypothetical protein
MVKIKKNLKATQDKQKSYVEKDMTTRSFKVGENVPLKVEPKKSSLKLGRCIKLATIFCGPFEILYRFGLVAYMLAFPASMNLHNVFHVSFIQKNMCMILTMLLIGI